MSSLGFGCASVMGKVSETAALRAMSEAFDLGITHFDVARSYGFGRAEAVLGKFLKGRRDKATLTTKFGVVPPRLSMRQKVLMPVARHAMQIVPSLAARARRQSTILLAERRFDTTYARLCLHESLRQLQTDYVDVYLLHEPVSLTQEQGATLKQFMLDAKKAGKVRRWGIACHRPSDMTWALALQPDVIQVEGNIRTAKELVAGPNDTTIYVTRPFCGGINREVCAELETRLPGILRRLEAEELSVADFLLAFSGRLVAGGGAIIAAMYGATHIRRNSVSLARSFRSAELMKLVDEYFVR